MISQNHRRLKMLLAGLVGLLTLAVFHVTWQDDFVQWDDDINIYGNSNIQGLSAAHLKWMFTDSAYTRRYMPLGWLGLGIKHELSGLNPSAFHLGNALLHSVNAILLFFLIRRLLLLGLRRQSDTGETPAVLYSSAAGAVLWAINPLRVEPVAWASGHLYLQAAFFLLVSLLCYLRSDAAPAGTGRIGLYWASVLASAASLLTYPIGLPIAGIFIVLDFFPLRRFNPGWRGLWDARARQVWLEKIPFVAVVALVFALTVWARMRAGGIWAQPPTLDALPIFSRVMQAFYVWAYYVWKTWMPFHLSPVYTTLVSFDPNSLPFWLSAAFVSATTVLLAWKCRRWPWALALWISHLMLFVPLLGLMEQPHYTPDRYDYLPSVLWAVLLAAALWKLSSRPSLRIAGTALVIALAALWGSLSVRQACVWRNSETLFKHMIHELDSDSYRWDIYWRLGTYYGNQGLIDEAVQQCRISLSIQPSERAYLALGEILEKDGDLEGALANYLAALQFRENPYSNIKAARVFHALGRTGEAIGQYSQALQSDANLLLAMHFLAWIWATDEDAANRNGPEAVKLAERACQLSGFRIPTLLGDLAAAYAETGRFEEAATMAEKAITLAQEQGDTDTAAKNQDLLKLYQSHKPCRDRPAGPPEARKRSPAG
jgi:protein O-mannosyl-transferase